MHAKLACVRMEPVVGTFLPVRRTLTFNDWQVKGYIGRYITYTGPDFKEGLSLSIHDEISRMRKYAFGCSELVFNPLSQWLCKCVLV